MAAQAQPQCRARGGGHPVRTTARSATGGPIGPPARGLCALCVFVAAPARPLRYPRPMRARWIFALALMTLVGDGMGAWILILANNGERTALGVPVPEPPSQISSIAAV